MRGAAYYRNRSGVASRVTGRTPDNGMAGARGAGKRSGGLLASLDHSIHDDGRNVTRIHKPRAGRQEGAGSVARAAAETKLLLRRALICLFHRHSILTSKQNLCFRDFHFVFTPCKAGGGYRRPSLPQAHTCSRRVQGLAISCS